MRIDDRKVNGRISIDATDIVEGFNIAILENDPKWVVWDQDTRNIIPIDPGIVVPRLISTIQRSRLTPLRFYLSMPSGEETRILSLSSYAETATDITLDIGALIPDKKLTISRTTGVITMV